jgi:hypothetical protein
MERQTLIPVQHLQKLTTMLVNVYHPDNIICFGSISQSQVSKSCFKMPDRQSNYHYYILMITTEPKRIEHEVQDYVTSHFDEAGVTLIAHGKQSVANAINRGNRFFYNGLQGRSATLFRRWFFSIH